jgi:hypothetical protein
LREVMPTNQPTNNKLKFEVTKKKNIKQKCICCNLSSQILLPKQCRSR